MQKRYNFFTEQYQIQWRNQSFFIRAIFWLAPSTHKLMAKLDQWATERKNRATEAHFLNLNKNRKIQQCRCLEEHYAFIAIKTKTKNRSDYKSMPGCPRY